VPVELASARRVRAEHAVEGRGEDASGMLRALDALHLARLAIGA
jgi:hypothetical protein